MDTKKRAVPLPPAVTRWTPIQPAPTRSTQPLRPHRATAGPTTPEPGPEAGWTPLELQWVEDAAAEPVGPADSAAPYDIEFAYDEPPVSWPDAGREMPFRQADATPRAHDPATAPGADLDAEDPWTDLDGELLTATSWDLQADRGGTGFYPSPRGPDREERPALETPTEPIGAFTEPPRPAWSPPGAVEESARPDGDEPDTATAGSVPLWNPEHPAVADAEGWRDLVVPQNLTSAGTDWADEAAAWETVAAGHAEDAPMERGADARLVERMADQLAALAAALREEGLPSLERAMRGNRLHAALASLLVGYAAAERDRGP
jgi:hypothetical protein